MTTSVHSLARSTSGAESEELARAPGAAIPAAGDRVRASSATRTTAIVAASTFGIGVAFALLAWLWGVPTIKLGKWPATVVGLLLGLTSSMSMIRLYVGERRRTTQVRGLYDAMRVARQDPDLDASIPELLDATRNLLRSDVAWIGLAPMTSGGEAQAAATGPTVDRGLREGRLSKAEAQALELASSVRGAIELSSERDHVARGLLAQLGVRAGLLVALRGENGLLGALVVGGSRFERGDTSPEDVRLFETYARHAAVLLENDRLESSLSDVRRLQQELRHQAFHDALTGLPNRALFVEEVRRMVSSGGAGSAAVLFLDLDDFKTINDSLGHHAGDALLVAVASRFRAAVRSSDLPARLGGDEFGVVTRVGREGEAEQIAERLLAALETPVVIDGREIAVHASIGIAVGGARTSPEELLRNADVAMYEAKHAGKRQLAWYEPQMHVKVRRRHETATALERAVERGQITLHYQPIVDLETRRLASFEALARWDRDEHGLLTPASFIPLADEIGLMMQIGRVVLREACRQAVSWQRSFPGYEQLSVNVNLAPSELHDPRLLAEVADVLEETGLDPSRLVLEITESGVMRSPIEARRTMAELRAFGVSLAMDDFGTGHSSLAHLREFPLDSLKIADPFVAGLPRRHTDQVFVETIVKLATSLGLTAVAEGIETSQQADTVAALGCRHGQGYFFGEPLGALGLAGYLASDTLPSAGNPFAASPLELAS